MRADKPNGQLRGCPTCGTKVDATDLRLRDFSWVNDKLPGSIGGMDIDFVLSSAKSGRTLMVEMKPPNGYVSMGAKLTYQEMVKLGVDVWVAWGPDDEGQVEVGSINKFGRVKRDGRIPVDEFAERVAAWWEANK